MIKKSTYTLDSNIDGLNLPSDFDSIISIVDMTESNRHTILTQISIPDLLTITPDLLGRHFIIADNYLYLFGPPYSGKVIMLRYNSNEVNHG